METGPWVVVLLLGLAAPLAGCLHDDNSWALGATGLAALRGQGLDGRTVRVAVLDTGFDPRTPSLRHLVDGDPSNGELAGYADFVGEDGGPRDRNGHGTFVIGVLAGAPASGLSRLRPGIVLRGAAPDVALLVARVNGGDRGSAWALMAGLDWALHEHADVISLSLGVPAASLADDTEVSARLHALLAQAESQGVLVVAAAGNRGTPLFPASEPTVLAVGSAGPDGRPIRPGPGTKPDLIAPGIAVTGPARGGGLLTMDGTSAAVPFVAAAGALLIAGGQNPSDAAGVAHLRQALVSGARPTGGAPFLDAAHALRLYG